MGEQVGLQWDCGSDCGKLRACFVLRVLLPGGFAEEISGFGKFCSSMVKLEQGMLITF